MKIPLIVANWKMHKTGQEAKAFIAAFVPQLSSSCRVYIAPSFTALQSAVEAAQGSLIEIGAQNMHDQEAGAFTGEVSAAQLKAIGARFVLLGHSERRHYFGEDNAWIQRKVQRALMSGLKPILCVGEQLQERESGQWQKVLEGQLAGCLGKVTKELTIAYEPVWAIGTGRVATPEMAQEAHHFIRTWLKKQFGEESAAKVDLLYGGSVKPDNTATLLEQEDIDGLLVGGASLDVESFAKIVNY